jgi:RNA polymerase sigma factor (sigma-70 family)
MTDTQALLDKYVRTGSETAFRELVARYVNLVHSTALRLVGGDRHLAEDVAQTVFVHLAAKARTLSQEVTLGGWLHRDTCFVARTLLRGERRRWARERQAAEMNRSEDHSGENLAQLAPILDEAINELGEEDRRAILLRFFEQRDFCAVGQALGGTEDAARMRVNRALNKLEALLKHRGVALSAAALGTLLAGEAVTAAPAGLAATIAGTALAGATAGAGTGATLLKAMSMTKAGIVGALALAAIATPLTIQHRAVVRLRNENQTLHKQVDQLPRLVAENQKLSNRVANAHSSLSDKEMNELLHLRGEVGLLRQQAGETAKLQEENQRLQAALAQAEDRPPKQVSPSDQQRLVAMAKMNDAKLLVLGEVLYAQKHEDDAPTSLDQVSSFLPTNGSTLTGTNQFELVYQGAWAAITNPASTIVLREKQACQTLDGDWVRTYGFADGHSEVHTAPDGNFVPWETQHMIEPPPSGQ